MKGTPCYLTTFPEKVWIVCQRKNLRNKIHGLHDRFVCFFFVGSVYFLPEGRRLPAGCQNKFSVPRLVSAQSLLEHNQFSMIWFLKWLSEKCFADRNFPLLSFSTIPTSSLHCTPKHFIISPLQKLWRKTGRQLSQEDPAVYLQLVRVGGKDSGPRVRWWS